MINLTIRLNFLIAFGVSKTLVNDNYLSFCVIRIGLFSMHLQIAINTFYAKIATAENYLLKKLSHDFVERKNVYQNFRKDNISLEKMVKTCSNKLPK